MEWAYVLGAKNAAEIRDSLLEQGYLSDWCSVGMNILSETRVGLSGCVSVGQRFEC